MMQQALSRIKASFIATVSKGTYIRTLAHDIAHTLKTVGVVTRLHRIQDGPFKITEATVPDAVAVDKIFPLESVLNNLVKLEVTPQISWRLQHGQRIKDKNLTFYPFQNTPLFLTENNKLIGIGIVQKDVIHPKWIL